MTFNEIQKLIATGETRTLELKKSTGELKDAMHTACAFLNTEGGWLVFGVTPQSHKIVGQDVNDNTQQELAQALSLLEPALDVRIEYIDIPDNAGRKVIAINFDGWIWGKEPYTYHGSPYYKVESTTRIMPRDMFEERLKAAKPHKLSWERLIADEISINDLNEDHIINAVRMGVRGGRMPESALSLSANDILKKFSLTKNGQLLQAAVVLFARNVQDYPQLLMRLARFKGVNKLEFIDNRQVRGDFFDLLDEGMAFCFKHLNLHGKVVGLQREEKLEIPVEALREAIINALCHRSYDSISGSVSLAIYDDRLEIENPGRFPVGITPDNIKESHDSKPFNPIIAETLYKCTWLESWGSGVDRMVNACKADNAQEPFYELRPGGLAIVFKRPKVEDKVENKSNPTSTGQVDNKVQDKVQDKVRDNKLTDNELDSKTNNKANNKANNKSNPTSTGQVANKVANKVAKKVAKKSLTKTEQTIVQLLKKDVNITMHDICKSTGLSLAWIKRNLSSLRKKGIIERQGARKNGYWIVNI